MVEKLDAVVKTILWIIGGIVILYQSVQSCIWGLDCYSKTPKDLTILVTWVFTSANGGLIFVWIIITVYVIRRIIQSWELKHATKNGATHP